MPLEFSEHTSEGGMPYLRADASGQVSFDDAKAFEAQVKRPEWHRGMVLSVVAKGTEYLPAARKHFAALSDDVNALATVVTSPIMRATMNMMLRLGRVRGKRTLRMFTSEAEAITWLESEWAKHS